MTQPTDLLADSQHGHDGLVASDCTAISGVQDWLRSVLELDEAPLAAHALRRLAAGSRVFCLLGRGLDGVSALQPSQSAMQLGSEWLVDAEAARRDIATRLLRIALERPGSRVSSSLVFMKPTDEWHRSEALVVSYGSQVWATSSIAASVDEVERVIRLEEGYPPGVGAVHSGEPWSSGEGYVSCLSGFDCETYFWWVC